MRNAQGNRSWAAVTVALILMMLAASIASAQTYSILYAFQGGTDGSLPETALIPDPVGNLYGATVEGGDLSCGAGLGCGVILSWTRLGTRRCYTASPVARTGPGQSVRTFSAGHGGQPLRNNYLWRLLR
jgi:hypothetical protein